MLNFLNAKLFKKKSILVEKSLNVIKWDPFLFIFSIFKQKKLWKDVWMSLYYIQNIKSSGIFVQMSIFKFQAKNWWKDFYEWNHRQYLEFLNHFYV